MVVYDTRVCNLHVYKAYCFIVHLLRHRILDLSRGEEKQGPLRSGVGQINGDVGMSHGAEWNELILEV